MRSTEFCTRPRRVMHMPGVCTTLREHDKTMYADIRRGRRLRHVLERLIYEVPSGVCNRRCTNATGVAQICNTRSPSPYRTQQAHASRSRTRYLSYNLIRDCHAHAQAQHMSETGWATFQIYNTQTCKCCRKCREAKERISLIHSGCCCVNTTHVIGCVDDVCNARAYGVLLCEYYTCNWLCR